MTVFSTSISALKSLRTALETTSHNIANASNPDYSRQSVELGTRGAQKIGPHMIGTGVIIQSVDRNVDTFMNNSYRDALSNGAQADFYYDVGKLVDSYVGDLDTGVSRSIEEYYNALQAVSVNPSYEAKGILLARGEALAQRVKDFDGFMRDRYLDIKSQQTQIINTTNQLAISIANINREISDVINSSSTTKPNDLLDQRDAYVNELSTYMDINIVEDSNQQFNISCGNGINLVVGATYGQLTVANNIFDGNKYDILLKGPYANLDITENVTGGMLGGSLQARNELLDEVNNRMGRMLTTLSLATNQVHEKGMDELGFVGKKFFYDVNSPKERQTRTVANPSNDGDAAWSVGFSSLYLDDYSQDKVIGNPSALENLSDIPANSDFSLLSINNKPISTPIDAFDTISNEGNYASAISAAYVINQSTAQTGVTATAVENVLLLGQFKVGTSSATSLSVCGQAIDLSQAETVWQLAEQINQSSVGVEAQVQPDKSLVLFASDGRNIDIQTDGSDVVSSFTYLDTTTAEHKIQRAAIALEGNEDFTLSENFQNLGLPAQTYPASFESLEASTYTLSFDGGTYTLIRDIDQSRVYRGVDSSIRVDGLEIDLSYGAAEIGDVFQIKPYKNIATNFAIVPKSAKEVALALPLKTVANNNNKGDGSIDVSIVKNNIEPLSNFEYGEAFTSGALNPPLKIEFLTENSYVIKNGSSGQPIGPSQYYDGHKDIVLPMGAVANDKQSSGYVNQTYRPGYQVQLSGDIKAGDSFNVVFNSDGKLDTRGALAMSSLQTKNLIDQGTATCEQEYTQISASVATITAQMRASGQSYEKLIETIQDKRLSVSGVNLDEEAANIMQLQQAYQAAAQMLAIQRTLFDSMLSMMR